MRVFGRLVLIVGVSAAAMWGAVWFLLTAARSPGLGKFGAGVLVAAVGLVLLTWLAASDMDES